ncbi:MAG: hypothetical protein J6A37_01425 [Oscillospiraceae bacterium]|nr:hypothetical protein [Oscillospiraceae bacterium]
MSNILSELTNDEYTEFIFDKLCDGEPKEINDAEDVEEGIVLALSLENRNVFLEGLSARLTELGFRCCDDETESMLAEMKSRYKRILNKTCPRTVIDWIKGITPPGVTNRHNHYDVCYALEMDHLQTAVFFQKHYLTVPYNSKSRIDAVYLYCIYHNKPYSTVVKLLDNTKNVKPQPLAHTSTSQISQNIISIDDDDKFLDYLSKHYYNEDQHYLHAKELICNEIAIVKETILKDISIFKVADDRLNSLTVAALLGYKSQAKKEDKPSRRLPKRFKESLPSDVTIGQILNGDRVSYEVLRKTFMLLKFYNFYTVADNCDAYAVGENFLDFMEELNLRLLECGFAQIYMRHPFDCLLMYCANTYDPIHTLYCINEPDWNQYL